MSDISQTETITPQTAPSATTHERHCFVVMPFGRDPAEQKWFRGWYEVVIKAAVVEAGFEPKLAAAEEQPGAINDEIRSHLALNPMVIVDLGGAEPEDDPNPNVMYELGIRHALSLPLVMLAWKGQRLPFDVGNQRIIMEERDLMDLEQNRKRLVTFIHAAQQGRYYRPMEAVGRIATIQAASESLGEDSLLRALAQEVRDLRLSVVQTAMYRETRWLRDTSPTVKKLVRGKVFRKELYPHFVDLGGTPATWNRLLNTRIPPNYVEAMEGWGCEEWKQYVSAQFSADLKSGAAGKEAPGGLDDDLLAAVQDLLPAQPWPQGVHKDIAEKLGLTDSQVGTYIKELVRRGAFTEQVQSQLFRGEEAG